MSGDENDNKHSKVIKDEEEEAEKYVSSKRRTLPPHLVKDKDYSALEELFRHHIESFDHMVEYGLETMLLNIKPVQIVHSFSNQKLRNILLLLVVDLLCI